VKTRILPLVVALCALAPTACMYSPENGQEYCGIEAPVHIAGRLLGTPNGLVTISALDASGAWVDIGTATSAGTPSYDIHNNATGTQEQYYDWDMGTRALAPAFWRVEGNQRVAYIRPRQARGSAFVYFDRPGLRTPAMGPDWLSCALSRWGQPNTKNLYEAISSCGTGGDSVRIVAPLESTCPCPSEVVLGNDLTIDSPAQLGTLRCLVEVQGNLSIRNTATLASVKLPALRKVDGDLIIDYTPPAGQAQTQRTINLPALTSVGDDLNVKYTGRGAATTLDLQLPDTVAIGGDVTVAGDAALGANGTPASGAITLVGLRAVASIGGDLILGLGTDVDTSGFLAALTDVGGSVRLAAAGSVTGFLPSLVHVAHDVVVSHLDGAAPRSDSLGGLGSLDAVDGQVTLQGTRWPGFTGESPAFGRLTRVAGALRLLGTRLTAFDLGTASLHLGSLELSSNGELTAMPPRALRVVADGEVAVIGNAKLPTCQIEAFLIAQQDAGWAGAYAVDGNDDVAVCQ
jgi:hypothetical protein